MKHKLIFHAFWIFLAAFIFWSCGRPARATSEQTATIISDSITITTFPSLARSQEPTLASTLYPTLPFTQAATITPTVTPTPSPTVTHQPTATPPATLTSFPTIFPSITPTFDAYHLATATRSPAEVCPQINPDVKLPDFEALFVPPYDHLFQQDYLDYFNAGGIAGVLPEYWRPEYKIDLTNDRIPEFIFRINENIFILGCQSGKYQLLLDIRLKNRIFDIKDANQNGFPELILGLYSTTYIIDILEWDAPNVHLFPYNLGNETLFRSLWVPNDRHIDQNGVYDDPMGRTDFKFEPMDLDPLLELAAHIRPPYFDDSFYDGFPWRNEVDYYKWNGSSYVFAKQTYDPPLFRYQAVHDGDWSFKRGEYDQAIKYYQLAIKDDNLYWYTEARRYFFLMNDWGWNSPAATPTNPIYDPDEYPNLAAYSYFRMMLADIKNNHLAQARTTYDWLQANFTVDKPGHVYAELAALFWNEYQKSHDFASSCSLTYDYASSNPEDIFRYLTTQIVINKKLITWQDPIHFGVQSAELEYSPAMICPSQ
jgi:hypothetical protein